MKNGPSAARTVCTAACQAPIDWNVAIAAGASPSAASATAIARACDGSARRSASSARIARNIGRRTATSAGCNAAPGTTKGNPVNRLPSAARSGDSSHAAKATNLFDATEDSTSSRRKAAMTPLPAAPDSAAGIRQGHPPVRA